MRGGGDFCQAIIVVNVDAAGFFEALNKSCRNRSPGTEDLIEGGEFPFLKIGVVKQSNKNCD